IAAQDAHLVEDVSLAGTATIDLSFDVSLTSGGETVRAKGTFVVDTLAQTAGGSFAVTVNGRSFATITLGLHGDSYTAAPGVTLDAADDEALDALVAASFGLFAVVLFYSERADYPASGDTVWASHTRVGLGVFSVGHPGETVRVYVGPRLGLLWGSNKLDGPTAGQRSTTANGWFAGGAIGGEYSPLPR